jgi:murein DD-endopeptidase MepM/ murein hydrolase activator NlpD
MIALPGVASDLHGIKPGDRLAIAAHEGQVLSLTRELDEIRLLSIRRNGSSFGAEIVDRPVDIRTASGHGVIKSALFVDGDNAGLSRRTMIGIYERFKWDIDFMHDQRVGDQFTVIYEELWRDGVKFRDGEVIAAEFVNQGKVYRAARYTDGAGHMDYFTPEGRSLRKAFLRAPLNFTRVSSTFNPNRRHPVLNTIRAHRGVDYAAPTGTPVEAAGDGRIITRGTTGGYGNAIEIDHGGDVTTLYGHLSSFARSQKVGTRVKQGDVIGYVGQSGLATGPHLHYEYRVLGVHKNPQSVALPPADPVPAEYRTDFQRATAPLWKQLDSYRPAGATTVATTASVD